MLLLLTVCALYVCLCDYVNMCMYLVLLCIFGKKLLRACVYCLQKPNSNKVFLSYLILCYADYDLNNVISKLESDSKKMLDWFANNLMQANPEKFQALAISKKTFKEQICFDLF